MQIPILADITIIFLFAAIALFICGKLKIPEIMGYLFAGVLVGPNGLRLIHAVEQVEMMAEIGVVLLLFTIGITFSLSTLLSLKRPALAGGGLQVAGCIAAFTGAAYLGGYELNTAVVIGMMSAVSGTAIMLNVFAARGEVDSLYGRISLAVSIFQDIAVIPMMLLVPLLAGQGGKFSDVGIILGKAVVVVVLLFAFARFLVPKLLYQVAATRSRELFMITVVLVCLGVAWMTSKTGLSLALGAFLAGIVVSESGYGQQALGDVIPFKDVFAGFFFVSIGMLLNPEVVLNAPVLTIISLILLIIIKFAVTGFVINIIGYPVRTSVLAGLSLAQVSEFSFILGAVGASTGILTSDQYSFFIAVTVLSMASTPFLIISAPHVAELVTKLPMPRAFRGGYLSEEEKEPEKELIDHIIIAGFGMNGRNTARAAREKGIEYVVIEMNPDTVRREKRNGTPIFFGDASQAAVLEHAALKTARVMVITLPDPIGVRKIVETARRENPTIYIIARTRYLTELEPLKALGANEIVVEEYETSIETFSRVLKKYYISHDEIEALANQIRTEIMGRPGEMISNSTEGTTFADMNIINITVPVGSQIAGKTVRDVDIRFRYRLNLLAVNRGTDTISNPGSDFAIQERDELMLMGEQNDADIFMQAIRQRQ
ncbi:monovalent cation:proton antiporter family protein [Seleniivibrio woodruffii]|uniref:monovalent cation:proton antiporter family protein n=1 Tax=Seleniivibrio woodruffii TaxID=1078050 RepID=UPI002409871C|nr:monovalent cation:proton antiporter family protein [Seleniivibrio woodruffii]